MSTDARETLKPTGSSLLTAVLVMAALYFGREVFVPLALAALLSFLLVPVATLLERWAVPRVPASLLVIFLSVTAVAVLGWVMLGQIYNLAVELPQYEPNITRKIESLHLTSASRLSNTLAMLSAEVRQLRGASPTQTTVPLIPEPPPRRTSRGRAASPAPSASPTAPLDQKNGEPITVRVVPAEESVINLVNRTLSPLLHPVTTTFIVVIFLAFMLVGRDDLRDRAIRLAGRGRMQITTSAIEDASRRVGRYLRMQLVVNITFGGLAGLLLWRIGVPSPLLWALSIALLRFVPYIGILLASAGPLFLAIAVSTHWGMFLWTAVMLATLELVVANVVEPLLYGSSTGLTPIAILIAAIFWTLIWGLPGLLLSTPLTVCLVVIGRQVPQLHYLNVLLGDETALPPPERLYQRLLASNTFEARHLLQSQLNEKPPAVVFDTAVIPALTLIEESRHAEEITNTRAEEVLQNLEEIVEDILSRKKNRETSAESSRFIACIPARDFADEVASQLAAHVLSGTAMVRVFPADTASVDIFETFGTIRADVICIIGVPPSSLRHIRLRCRQARAHLPEATIVACLLSENCDLPNIRSRIPTEDAHHVVCSLQLMQEYLFSLLSPSAQPWLPLSTEEAEDSKDDARPSLEFQGAEVIDESRQDAFQRLANNLARALDAPIALITVAAAARPQFWEAQCGLPKTALFTPDGTRAACVCSVLVDSESLLVINDTNADPRSSNDPFFSEHGIRFYAGAPLRSHDGTLLGALCVLDTRPRQITEKQKETLLWIAEVVVTAIEIQIGAASEAYSSKSDLQLHAQG